MVDVHPAAKINLTSPNKCKGCNEPIKKFSSWCKSCVSSYFSKNFKNWTSGNQNLDEFIRDIQLKEQRFNLAIEWIPFDRLTDLTLIKRGGFGTVYKATWLDGYINEWDLEKDGWKRAGKKTVCLKQIHNSNDNITKEFLEAIQHQVRARSTRVISVYGFTQDTSTKDYMIVMQYSSEGSLRESLDKNFNSLSWYDKLNILKDSANGLKDIHKLGLHRNLHPGNIIMIDKSTPNFSDFGMCKPIGHYKSASNEVFGVLPYVAPEVLAGRKYTQDADVYSFSIIMYEVLTGLPPYYNVPHDSSLAMEIHKGLRPECNIEEMPPVILDYMKRCWDPKTSNRPTAQDVFYNISQWLEKYKDKESTLCKQIKNIEDSKDYSSADAEKRSGPLRYEINSSAVYHSRPLDFAGPKNSEKDISGKARCCNTGVLSKITSFFFSS